MSKSFESYGEALTEIPDDAKWSSSFGYAGEGGYVEYWRSPDGTRHVIQNGKWDAVSPFVWTVGPEKVSVFS